MINISIDGKGISPDQLAKRVMGFGQKHDLPEYNFSIKVDRSEFITLFTDVYNQCIEELKLDDEKYGAFEPPYEGALSYPTLEVFIEIGGQDFYNFFKVYFDEEIFEKLCMPHKQPTYKLYGANSIDNINISENYVEIVGKAFLSPSSINKKLIGVR